MKKTLAWILCAILILSLFTACGETEKKEEATYIDWEELTLGSMLPKPETLKGECTNYDDRLLVYLDDVSKSTFDAYKQSCADKGFNVDAYEEGSAYFVYNADGYKLKLSHSSYDNRVTILLESPLKAEEFGWPIKGVGALLPTPNSNKGVVSWNNEETFSVKMTEMNPDSYAAYVDACMESGFTVNYRKDDTHFKAENDKGYKLELQYEGFNIVNIFLGSPDDEEPAATEAAPTEPAATEPAPTQKADDGALRSDFKEAMDAYEAAMNEYADFMEKYQENPTDLSLLKDYPAMMEKFEEAGNALDAWDSEDMNAAELAYYTAVVERVNKRLLSVGQ